MASSVSPHAIVGKDGFLFLGVADSNRLVEHLSGELAISKAALSITLANQAAIKNLNVPFAGIVVPEAHVAYEDKLPNSIRISKDRPISQAMPLFDERVVYLGEFLKRQRDEGLEVYTGNDSHWTDMAAFKAYEGMRARVGRTTPFEPTYTLSTLREPQDLRVASREERAKREAEMRKLTGTGAHPIFKNGLLNHGWVYICRNPSKTGRCLAFGTSFSNRLVPAYASDFEEVVFCYGTTIDPLIVDIVKPDVVFSEVPERFIHYPSAQITGGTLVSAFIGTREDTYADALLAKPTGVSAPVANLVTILSQICDPKREITPETIELVATYSTIAAERLSIANDLVKNSSKRQELRAVGAGQFLNLPILQAMFRMVDDGTIRPAHRPFLPRTEMGMLTEIRVLARNGNAEKAKALVEEYDEAFGPSDQSKRYRQYFKMPAFGEAPAPAPDPVVYPAPRNGGLKLYLHIGHQKTGSSHIQSALASSIDTLTRNGIHYPIDQKSRSSAAQGGVTSGNIEQLRSWVRGDRQFYSKHTKYLFSSELIFGDMKGSGEFRDQLAHFAANAGFEEVNVLMFIRDPVSLSSSSYQQWVKGLGHSGTIEAAFKFFDDIGDVETVLDFLDRISAHRSVYNYGVEQKRLLPIVEDWIGLPENTLTRPPIKTVNRSLTRAELELQRNINALTGKPSGHLFAQHVVEKLPDIRPDSILPAVDVQEALWDRLAPKIERVNARIPAEARYSRERDIRSAAHNSTPQLAMTAEQLAIVAKTIADLAGGR